MFNATFNNISVISCMAVSFIGGGNRRPVRVTYPTNIIKNKKYHTVGRKIVERGKIDTPSAQIHDWSLSWLGTDTSIKNGRVLWDKTFPSHIWETKGMSSQFSCILVTDLLIVNKMVFLWKCSTKIDISGLKSKRDVLSSPHDNYLWIQTRLILLFLLKKRRRRYY